MSYTFGDLDNETIIIVYNLVTSTIIVTKTVCVTYIYSNSIDNSFIIMVKIVLYLHTSTHSLIVT